MKFLLFTFCAFLLVGCGLLLNNKIDIANAEKFITKHQATQQIDSVLLKKSNAQNIAFNTYGYLFVANSFNGDYNGRVWLKDTTINIKKIKFGDLYIKTIRAKKGHWLEVYGGW